MAEEQHVEPGSNSFDWLFLDTLRRMRDAAAEGNSAKYFTYTEWSLDLVVSHIPAEARKGIKEDYKLLRKLKMDILNDKTINEQSKKKIIDELKHDWADAHKLYAFLALPKLGIVKREEDGTIDFKKLDIDRLAKLVRSLHDPVKQLKEEEKNGTPALAD